MTQQQHMDKLGLVLLIFGFVCFVMAAWFEAHWQKLVAVGLAFVTAATIFGGVAAIFH